MLQLEYSYLSLPSHFYQLVKPTFYGIPEVVFFNETLLEELGISAQNQDDITADLLSAEGHFRYTSFAQAYAGHQFGGFTKLGDGRAIVMGEYITPANERIDVQLKGSGRTPYSRGGDGKATLKAMLREYLMSEAMHYLKIPTSRSLFVAKTGEWVQRETEQEGSVVARLMKSHIRIGTFEYARYFGTIEDLKALSDYTINRLYPDIQHEENPVLGLLNKVMSAQIDLVVNWMRVGFIHGVMNTDNVSISGETFDYGPCAFMNTYDPLTVYSSIDRNGRYSFENQAQITKWNIVKFAEAILPILDADPNTAVKLAQACIDNFDTLWNARYYQMMLKKIGILSDDPKLYSLVDELLECMKNLKMDYNNTFWNLSQDFFPEESPMHNSDFKPWLEKWKNTIDVCGGMKQAKELMNTQNPVYIPRNHLVEQALEDASHGNMDSFQNILSVMKNPYLLQNNFEQFMKPADLIFEQRYQTFCGT
jgi:uncharacterized protein YdiU (UPF0061 family)